jgi:hypothetical protein
MTFCSVGYFFGALGDLQPARRAHARAAQQKIAGRKLFHAMGWKNDAEVKRLQEFICTACKSAMSEMRKSDFTRPFEGARKHESQNAVYPWAIRFGHFLAARFCLCRKSLPLRTARWKGVWPANDAKRVEQLGEWLDFGSWNVFSNTF